MVKSSNIHFINIINNYKLRFVFYIALSFITPFVQAETVSLTEDQALQLFFERNLGLLAARYNIENAQAQEIVASAIPNPTIGVQVMELSSRPNYNSAAQGCSPNTTCGPAEMYMFSQLIEMAGKRGLRMESSAVATQAAESDFRDAVRILTNMVRDAYYTLLLAQKTRWLAQENFNHYKDIVSTNSLRLKAGDIAEGDFLRIEVESFKAQSDLDNANAAIKQAQADLAVVLRWPDKSMQFAAQDSLPSIKDIGQNFTEENLINKALPLRPDLQGDKQRADQAAKDLTLARRLKYPDITLNVGETRDPSNTILNTYLVGISVPVPLFYQYQGESSKAAVSLNQMLLAAQQTELDIRNDVVSSLSAWQSADAVVKRFEGQVLDRVLKIRQTAELAYSKGATSVLDLIEAQRNYKAIMLDYNNAVINRINAYYDLCKAIGIEPNTSASSHFREPYAETH